MGVGVGVAVGMGCGGGGGGGTPRGWGWVHIGRIGGCWKGLRVRLWVWRHVCLLHSGRRGEWQMVEAP